MSSDLKYKCLDAVLQIHFYEPISHDVSDCAQEQFQISLAMVWDTKK